MASRPRCQAKTEREAESHEPEGGEEIVESWRDRLIGVLLGLDPSAFERVAQRLPRESGFVNVTVTG